MELKEIERAFYRRLINEKTAAPLNQIVGFAVVALKESERIKNIDISTAATAVINRAREVGQLLDEYNDLNAVLDDTFRREDTRTNVRDFVTKLYSSFQPMAKVKGLKFELELSSVVPFQATFDSKRTNYILRNLIDNAIRYTATGRVLIAVDVVPGNEDLLFEVYDDGIGISEERFQAIVGAPDYFIESSEAPGFGLRFAYRIAKRLSGSLSLTLNRERGKGTIAKLQVPSTDHSFLQWGGKLEDHHNLIGRVLLVEDNMDYQRLYLKQLSLSKLECTLTTGVKGLDVIESGNFDLILMDLTLKEISVTDLIKRVRRGGIQTPLYIISSQDTPTLNESLTQQGASGILTRNALNDSLLPEVARLLSESTSYTENSRKWATLLQERIKVYNELARSSKWEELMGELQKIEALVPVSAAPIIREQLMVLEAWCSAYDYGRVSECLLEIQSTLNVTSTKNLSPL
jgi:DNA-binding response OmpR family regulator